MSAQANASKSLFQVERINVKVDKMMEAFRKENEDEDSEEFKRDIQLQKKYFCSWGCGKQNQHHVMEMYKINMVKKFKLFCDDEKWRLKGLCSETKSYFQNL